MALDAANAPTVLRGKIFGMGLQRFPLGGFLGGMNLVDNPYSLKSGEAQLALDVDLGLRDVLSSRKGFSSKGLAGTLGSQTKSPTVVSNVLGDSGSPILWTNPENAKASDNTYATFTVTEPGSPGLSRYLKGSSFGFVLPAGAVPYGVVVEIERKKDAGVVEGKDSSVKLFNSAGAVMGNNKAKKEEWSTEETVAVYGAIDDLWGTVPTKAEVESANFGVGLSVAIFDVLKAGELLRVDQIKMTVHYIVEGVTNRVDHARPWYSGAKRRLIMSQAGTIRSLDTGAITELFAGTAATTWSFEQMEYSAPVKDSIWAMNGVDAAKKWDGTTFANWAGKPPKGNMLRVWKNMMIVSGVAAYPQRVFFSDVGNPESPEDETNGGYGNRWIDIRTSEDDLDPVVWLEVLDDVLLVFKRKSVNAIYDSTTFSFQRIANVGCEGRFLSCVLDERAYFANRSGVYSITAQGALRYESLNIEPLFKGTNSEIGAIDLSLLASAGRMCALPNGRVYLACTKKGEQANRWLLEAYPRLRGVQGRDDPRTPWVKHSFSARCVKSMCTFRASDEEVDRVVAGLTNEAGVSPELVYLFEGTRDGVATIGWQWMSGYKALISEEPKERIRRVDLLMKGHLEATMFTDGVAKASKVLETSESGAKIELERFRPESRGRYHAVLLSDATQVSTSVYKGELVLRGGKEH